MVDAEDLKPWILAYLPSVILFFVVLAASLDSRQSGLGNHRVYLGEAPHAIDVVVRHAGVIMPFFVLLLQTLVLSYDELAKLGIIGDAPDISCLHCLARRWAWTVFLLWIILAVLRVVLFIPLRTVHLWFSDHLFLIECVLAQLQTQLFVLHRASFVMRMPDNQGKDESRVSVVTRARVLLVITWIMVFALLFEAYFTAKYFHSVIADWTAFVSGTLLFGLAAGWWIQKLINSRSSNNNDQNAEPNARLKEPLCA